ncbi:2-oxoacid:acceptor oxidoreductase family protein [Sulfurifustis variabilis]|nr:2-oxoacid:acceptor oxidoreductase family protein [Sulfurifustis variabilis]
MPNNASIPYPGTPTTADGSAVVVWLESHVSDGACAYPITPSTNMGSGFQLAAANGQQNLWGDMLFFLEPESEHSSASACEGFALAGGRVTNFTSGQGLVLMKEVLYTISGKRLPVVFHIGARALTSHALNVHAGHDDVMAVADCGWGMLFARNAQEAQDLGLIARRAAEASHTPFMSIQDGFLTTHTIERVRLAEPELMREFVGHPRERLASLFDPAKPLQTGTVQNQDAYMKGKIAQREFTDRVPAHLTEAFAEFARLTGRRYGVVDAYRLEDAEYAIVGLGSVMETAIPAVDWMRERLGWKVGLLHVTCFRPFPADEVVTALKDCRAVSIIERMDNPLARDNPLALEVKAAFATAATRGEVARMPRFHAGVYGLGSRDTRVGDLIAVAQNMVDGGKPVFALNVRHPLALERLHDPDVRPAGAYSMRGHSVGGYGSVTTNKVIASLIEEIFGLEVQAYPKYGSDKKGLPTTYYLTAAATPIREHAELEHVDFVAIHDINAFAAADPLSGVVEGGTVFIQSRAPTDAEVWRQIPPAPRETIRSKNLTVLYLDAVRIARGLAATADLQLRMQGIVLLGVFLRAAPFVRHAGVAEEALFQGIEKALRKYFGRRGEKVIEANLSAVRQGYFDARTLDVGALADHADAKESVTADR